MPRARVRMDITAKPGLFFSIRSPYFRSCHNASIDTLAELAWESGANLGPLALALIYMSKKDLMAGRSRRERGFCPLVGCDVAESDIADRVFLSVEAWESAWRQGPESFAKLHQIRS